MRFASHLVAASVTVLGCASALPQPTREQACHGTAIHLDRVASICAVNAAQGPPPSPDAVQLELRPDPLYVELGAVLHARVRLTNTTAMPLDLDLALGPPAFTAVPLRDDGTVANAEEGEPASDAGVAPARLARITLEPGGWAEKEVDFTPGKMDPGTYQLQVTLPLPAEPTPGQAGPPPQRSITAPVVVTRSSG